MEWLQKKINVAKYQELLEEIEISPLTAKLLVGRGVDTPELAKKFLYPDFNKDLHNPLLFMDVYIFLRRVTKAKNENQKVLIHTDYDCDGVFTTNIYVIVLRDILKMNVEYFAPNRFKDGYGVNVRNFDYFKEYDLIITGDTGIKAYESIGKLTDAGVDVLVTDHHEPMVLKDAEENRSLIPENTTVIEKDGDLMVLPKCLGVINPKRFDCEYPSKDLCGAGVAFKLMQALLDYLHYDKKQLFYLLDGVATASVADLVPLINPKNDTFEVRNMVKIGLVIMNSEPKIWTQSIMKKKLEEKMAKNPKAKNQIKTINSVDLGYTFGPIMNAVGRLYDPKPAIEYVLNNSPVISLEKASELISINKERQEISKSIAKEMIEELKLLGPERVDYAIVVDSNKLHEGITGLIAGKILEEQYRTTIALAEVEIDGEKYYKGSARSIEGIEVDKALVEVQKIIGEYIHGGHGQAAGLTLKGNQLVPFRNALREVIKKQVDNHADTNVFTPKKYYDTEITLEEATHQQVFENRLLEPFGMGNPEPLFFAKNLVLMKIEPIGKEGQYAKLVLVQNGIGIEGVMFDGATKLLEEYRTIFSESPYQMIYCDVLFTIEINDYDNKVQLLIKELKFQKRN